MVDGAPAARLHGIAANPNLTLHSRTTVHDLENYAPILRCILSVIMNKYRRQTLPQKRM
jgi:hypothetical protein